MHAHVLLSGILAVFTLALTGCSSDGDDAAATSTSASIQYLGVGDSIAYGDDGFIDHTVAARPDPTVFVGYPDLVGKETFGGHYLNLGCPGATTGSFSSLAAMDNGCRAIQTDDTAILHVPYTTTQADKTQTYLAMNDVKVITVSLGGNDLLLTLSACSDATPDDPNAALACAISNLPKTLTDGAASLTAIFQAFKDQGFKGQLIYVNLYSTYAPSDMATLAVQAWNSKMAPIVTAAGGTVADVFTPFGDAAKSAGDPCTAGLLIPNPTAGAMPPCDVHPSMMGLRILADTVEASITTK